jgi:repressor LexA
MGHTGDGGPQYPGLTRRQRDIVSFCTDHYEHHGYPATLREIGAAVGLKSPSSVDYQVRELQRKGYLSRDLGRPRTTRPRTLAREVAAAHEPSDPGEDGWTLVQVIGRIAAGGPITAVDLPGEYVPLPPGISSTHEHLALEVVGDSMIGKAIMSGDRVVVRCGCAVSNGDIVFARFDPDTTPDASPEGDATLKTFKQVGRHVWLLPENPAYDPIPGDRAKIIGKVVYISRTLR